MKPIILSVLLAFAPAALAGGGSHDHPDECTPGQIRQFPAPPSSAFITSAEATVQKTSRVRTQIAFGVEYMGRILEQNGTCAPYVAKEGWPRFFVRIFESESYKVLRDEMIFTDYSLGNILHGLRNADGDLVGMRVLVQARDEFTVLCNGPVLSRRETKGALAGEIGNVAVDENGVDGEGVRCKFDRPHLIPQTVIE